ncbi:hypothetical protein SEVIR_2G056550v4 [Setaria viridis]|uniref:AP2/ERF domain-containing protein n=1 Tax=Setaria viridis TaxID=4556 RepID=A0A4U6VQF4_SETVI|nr:hypothetical protein SEVIR_2G056550v2 [Setaria viridis]
MCGCFMSDDLLCSLPTVYLGAFDSEEAAAHTYDLAALKYWGSDCKLNFTVSSESSVCACPCFSTVIAARRRPSPAACPAAAGRRALRGRHRDPVRRARLGWPWPGRGRPRPTPRLRRA